MLRARSALHLHKRVSSERDMRKTAFAEIPHFFI
jgi:hypothetical protein